MILTIVGTIIGCIVLYAGWFIFCIESTADYPPSVEEIEMWRRKAAHQKNEDEQLTLMYLAEAEAEFRASKNPKSRFGELIMALGAIIIILSIAYYICH